MIKAIIFDAYGTLISTGNGSVMAAGEILSLNGRADISPQEFYSRWKKLHREHIDSLKTFAAEEDIFKSDLIQLYREYGFTRDALEDVQIMLNTLGRRTAFPETREALEKLSDRFILAIGSTTDTEPLTRDLERNELTVKNVFTSESMQVYKPKKEFYEKIITALGVRPQEALFVGDSLIDDIAGPQSAGLNTCFVNRKGVKYDTPTPNFEIADLRGILEIL